MENIESLAKNFKGKLSKWIIGGTLFTLSLGLGYGLISLSNNHKKDLEDKVDLVPNSYLYVASRESWQKVKNPEGTTERVDVSIPHPMGRTIVKESVEKPHNDYLVDILQLVSPEGTNTIVNNPLNKGTVEESRYASWSPCGRFIAFSSQSSVQIKDPRFNYLKLQENYWEISVLDLVTNKSKTLTENNVEDYMPVWSPKGNEIAFVSKGEDKRSYINIMNSDGSNQNKFEEIHINSKTKLSDIYHKFQGLSWTPDGKKLIFQVDAKNPSNTYNHYLFLLDNEKNHSKIIEDDLYYESGFSVSKKGEVAYCSEKSKKGITIMDLNTLEKKLFY